MSASADARCRAAMDVQLQGRAGEAEQLYTEILRDDPAHALANHCLGMLKVQNKEPGAGVAHLAAALNLDAHNPQYWLGLLDALLLAKQLGDAVEMLKLARDNGIVGAEIDSFGRRLQAALPISAHPSRAERRRAEKTAAGEEVALDRLVAQGQLVEATAAARSLTRGFPDRGSGWKILGALLWAQGQQQDALAAMRRATQLLPGDTEALCNLGISLAQSHQYVEAESTLMQAIAADAGAAKPHGHLGDLYLDVGRLADAEASYRRACAIAPPSVEGIADSRWHRLLFVLTHKVSLGADGLFAEHVQAGQAIEQPFRRHWPAYTGRRDPDRCLNIGFVSGDFRNHAVATFVEPVIEALRRFDTLKLYAYYNHDEEDAVTARLKDLFQGWNPVVRVPDDALARRIRADGIDILIDLSGHTAHNRLGVFARRPAPIQASWIGYAGTTGLQAMDYYLADQHFLPAAQFASQFTEKLVYLPANVPFRPFEQAPEVAALPAASGKEFTFGSFNRLGKIDAATLDTWAAILSAVPGSRLIIGGVQFAGQEVRLAEHLQRNGVSPQRVRFRMRGSMHEYLLQHHDIDLCLDTFPYTGGTTTIHALWMGVPTLTIAGATPVSRQGAAILGQLQLEAFVARDAADCIDKAVHWASHLTELSHIRASLRQRWQRSPARRPELIADSLRRAFSFMWQRWCEGLPPVSFVAPSADQEDAGA